MQRSERSRWPGVVVVAGALLVGVAGLFHPILVGDAGAQLTAIAATRGWRVIHWSISFGYVLAVAGLAGIASLHAATRGASAARIGQSLVTFGYAVSLVGVLFMLGAAEWLAGTYRAGAPGRTASDAVFLYEALHPFALAALRVGALAVSLGIVAFGWAVKTARVLRGWLGWLGVGAGLVGAGIAAVLPAESPAIVTGIGLAVIWQLITGLLLVSGGSWVGERAPFERSPGVPTTVA